MKVGLIGSGGREYAMAKAFCRHPERNSLFVFASHHNPGIDLIASRNRRWEIR